MIRPALTTVRRRMLFGAIAVLCFPSPGRAESGSPPEIARGQVVERPAESAAAKVLRGTRTQVLRTLARAHAAELDSLQTLATTAPGQEGRWQREIEAAKRRHAREEISLQHDVALRDGRIALARRLELRLERFDAATRGGR